MQRVRRPSASYGKLKGATKRKGRSWHAKGAAKLKRGGGRH